MIVISDNYLDINLDCYLDCYLLNYLDCYLQIHLQYTFVGDSFSPWVFPFRLFSLVKLFVEWRGGRLNNVLPHKVVRMRVRLSADYSLSMGLDLAGLVNLARLSHLIYYGIINTVYLVTNGTRLDDINLIEQT